jgi:Bacterial Ig-like domain (group 1)
MVTLRTISSTGAVFLLLALLLPNAAKAQAAKEPSSLRIGAPDHANLGEQITAQAVLVDSTGRPISKATIYFVAPASFLSGSGDMVLAEEVTNKNGQAVTDFTNGLAGSLTLRAEFHGDDRYAPSEASAQIDVRGDAQLYVEEVGVHIPGLNEAPPMPVGASLHQPFGGVTPDVQALWPSLSGWPIALVLMLVWSLYIFAIVLIFRIAAAEHPRRGGYNVETGRFE